MSVEGVDYAFSRPSIPALGAAGKRFACRYGGAGTSGKWLAIAEARALTAAGLSIVANVEGSADGMRNGYPTGVAWAELAEQHFRTIGMPPDRPIYLSADFDVTTTTWPMVRDALRGAASRIGYNRVGVYGSYDVMVWARRDRVASWFWQTYAWSEGRWAPGNHIEQYRNGVTLAGGILDLDRALLADYGQWTVGKELDVELSDVVVEAATPDNQRRTVGQVYGDLWHGVHGRIQNMEAALAMLSTAVAGLVARPPVDLTDAQLELLADKVVTRLAPLIPTPAAVVDEEARRLAQ